MKHFPLTPITLFRRCYAMNPYSHRSMRSLTSSHHTNALLLTSSNNILSTLTLLILDLLDPLLGEGITTLCILHKQLLTLTHDARLLQSLPLASSHSILPPRNYRRVMDFEPKDLRLIPLARLRGDKGGIDLEQDVVERGAEVRPVDARVAAGLGVVDVLAFRAVQLHGLQARVVARADRQERMRLAHDPGTAAEVRFLELLDHLGEAAGRHDVARVDETVQVTGTLLDRLTHVVFAVEVEDVGDQVQGVLVVVHFCVEAGEVEAVGDVFLVDFAEVLIAARGDELGGMLVEVGLQVCWCWEFGFLRAM